MDKKFSLRKVPDANVIKISKHKMQRVILIDDIKKRVIIVEKDAENVSRTVEKPYPASHHIT